MHGSAAAERMCHRSGIGSSHNCVLTGYQEQHVRRLHGLHAKILGNEVRPQQEATGIDKESTCEDESDKSKEGETGTLVLVGRMPKAWQRGEPSPKQEDTADEKAK